jgi:hypothetical protein
MNTLSIRVRYRPIRLGFCVQKGNTDELRRALQLTHAFWGGRFNPVIPVGPSEEDRRLARSLIDAFHVDALHAVGTAEPLQAFVKEYPYLMWPGFGHELFMGGMRGRTAGFLDIYHSVRKIFEEHIKDKAEPRIKSTLYEWDANDPLGYVLLAQFGNYPAKQEVGKDYADFVLVNLRGEGVRLNAADPLPADALRKLTPSALSSWALEWESRSFWGHPGFYVGDAGDFDDLVNFWNLRAADIELIFHDPRHAARLDTMKAAHLEVLAKRPASAAGWPDQISIWGKFRDGHNPRDFAPNAVGCTATSTIWNGLNVLPPVMYISEHSVLASVDDDKSRLPSISFQLPKKPFFAEPEFHNQKVVVSVHPIIDIARASEATIKPPHIPELNEYYGREAHFIYNEARSEPGGLGIITDLTTDDLTIRALPSRQLIAKILEAFGMKAEPSRPGLIASRLIQQMGGLQGCRVFKIGGVRKLIEKYNPLESFTRSEAVMVIGQNDPATGRPKFEQYERLYIEQREEARLKPEHAFMYLVKKGVFRVGLKLKCTNCELDFWTALDDLSTDVRCELCGRAFNITGQLRDRDWAYRRSGLFGREDHQEGSIPVALTLQQMDTTLSRGMIYCTAMTISPLRVRVAPCETDFVLIGKADREGRVPLAIGECKSAKEIALEDVEHLKQVADAFPSQRIKSYIIFSKTSPFTPQEIERCRAAQDPHRARVILLSYRELEPYFVYERTEKEFEVRASAISLEDLAKATQNIYFEPRPKKQAAAKPTIAAGPSE